VGDITIPRAHRTEAERPGTLYGRFKRCVGRDAEYLESMLASAFATHFFSPSERERWSQLGRE